MTVSILGTEYKIINLSDEEMAEKMDCACGECGGYCSPYEKLIAISLLDTCEEDKEVKAVLIKRNIRHEIIHAFLHESGLYENSANADAWAMNEEMVDWIALQFPKILEAFRQATAL